LQRYNDAEGYGEGKATGTQDSRKVEDKEAVAILRQRYNGIKQRF